MKKLLLPGTLILVALSLFISAFKTTDTPPTSRVGYVSISQLITELPEFTANRSKLDTMLFLFNITLKDKITEYQQKEKQFVQDSATMLDAIKTDKITELRNLSQSIQAFRQASQEQVDKAESAMIQPIFNDIQLAIDKAADKYGFTHIINTDLRADNGSPMVLYAVEESNVSELISEEYQLLIKNKKE